MMNITVFQAQGRVPVTVLQPHGEIDASNFEELINAAREAVRAGAQDILLDLGEVAYMSSSGLVALQSIAALLRGEEPPNPESGWAAFRAIHHDRGVGSQPHFKLLNLQPRVEQMLDKVGFRAFLEIYADLDTAVDSF
jgi:anti-anti-sigma regulatory factor